MGAAVDIAVHDVTPTHHETVKATGAKLKHEITRLSVADQVERAKPDAGGGFGEAHVAHLSAGVGLLVGMRGGKGLDRPCRSAHCNKAGIG